MNTPFTAVDGWIVARLRSDHPVSVADLALVSPAFKPFASRLAGLPIDRREDSWSAFLDGRNGDREAITRSVADADPDGPCPEATEDDDLGDDDWGPIRYGTLPEVEPFPVDVLPPVVARLVTEGADAIGCPADFLAIPALAFAAGAIGRSVSLLLKDGYFASSSLFAACVGPPSDGKSPAFKAASLAVRRIDEACETAHAQAVERWEKEQDAVGSDGKRAKPTKPPRPTRIDVDDITMEALPLILADNPRGLIRVSDELTAIMLGMNQFKSGGKGNDRPNLLKIWSGDAIKKDRVGHEANAPIRCPHPCLTIVGGLPPDMLGTMADPQGKADGFLDRFLFAYPEQKPIPDWFDRGVSGEASDDWCALVARLWERPMDLKEGRSVPHVAFPDDEAKTCWEWHYNKHVRAMNAPDFAPSLRGPHGKFREYAGRLTLILACLDHASDLTADPAEAPKVQARHVMAAWRLVDYFKSHLARVHAAMAQGPGAGNATAEAVVGWLRSKQADSFSVSEIKQARRWIKDRDLTKALVVLIGQNVIREVRVKEPSAKGGRPPLPVYSVNPALLNTRNPNNPNNPEPDDL